MKLFVVYCAMDEVCARREPAAGGHGARCERTALRGTLALPEDAAFPPFVLPHARVMLRETREGERRAVFAPSLFAVPVVEPPPFDLLETTGNRPPVPDGFTRPFGCGRVIFAEHSHGMPPVYTKATHHPFHWKLSSMAANERHFLMNRTPHSKSCST